jgi:hypothetical protein
MLNEVNALNKLLACSARIEPEPRWRVHAGNCQAFIFARTLVGKLSEAWVAIKAGFFKTKLSKSYEPLLDQRAAGGIAQLKSYFGRKNLITSVRNGFSFHYSIEQAATLIPPDTDPEELSLYVHHHVGNSLYQFAEFAMNKALLDSIAPGEPALAMDRLLSEMSFIVARLNEFAQGMMMVILERFIGEEALRLSASPVELTDVPLYANVRIPFFIEKPPAKSGPDGA